MNWWRRALAPGFASPVRKVAGFLLSRTKLANSIRRWQALLRKVFEKLCRTWQPAWLRRRLLLASRFLYVASEESERDDLIFSHLLFPWVPGGSKPIVWNSQGISPAVYYERYNRGQWTVEDVAHIYRILGRRASALVIFTETCARNVVQSCPELKDKVHVVPTPIFLDAENPPPKPSVRDALIRLLFVGVDAVRKGLPEVLEAFSTLWPGHPNLQLDVVSRPEEPLRKQIAGMPGAHLHVSSPQVNVKALMAAADIFVLPTSADTYALAAVEAMAHGCAVIISDLQPLPEVFPDGEVGCVVPVGDSSALAARLYALATDVTLLRRLQAGARERYLRYHSLPVVAERLASVFRKVMETHARRDSRKMR